MFSLSPAQRGRLILGGVLVALIVFLLVSAYSALFPFLVGIFLVYLFLPVVNFLDVRMPRVLREKQISRPMSILLVYLLVALLLVGFFAIFVPLVSSQISELIAASGQYTMQLLRFTKGFNQEFVEEWQGRYNTEIPQWVRDTIASNIQQLTAFLANAAQNIVAWLAGALQRAFLNTLEVVSSTLGFVIGIIIVPFWVFYVLNDEKKLMQAIYSVIPRPYRADVRNLQTIIANVLGAYIRGQLILCLFIGIMATVGLVIMGVNFSVLLGTIAGIFEVIPTIGPYLGGVPAVLVALLKSPRLALETALLYFIIQQIENTFLVPRVAGSSVKLHPTVIMLVLVVGNEVAGVWGMVLAVPVTAILRDLFHYLYLRLSDAGISHEEAIALVQPRREVGSTKWDVASWPEYLIVWGKRAYGVLESAAKALGRRLQELRGRAREQPLAPKGQAESHDPTQGD